MSVKAKQNGTKSSSFQVVIFNDRLGDVATHYLKKGSKIYLEGQLQTRKWKDNMGHERYTTEVVLQQFRGELTILDSREDADHLPALPESLEQPTEDHIDSGIVSPDSQDTNSELPFK